MSTNEISVYFIKCMGRVVLGWGSTLPLTPRPLPWNKPWKSSCPITSGITIRTYQSFTNLVTLQPSQMTDTYSVNSVETFSALPPSAYVNVVLYKLRIFLKILIIQKIHYTQMYNRVILQ